VIETSHRLQVGRPLRDAEARAYARGYFDAEGGVPRQAGRRLYFNSFKRTSMISLNCGSY
jgi:hypothetical protein